VGSIGTPEVNFKKKLAKTFNKTFVSTQLLSPHIQHQVSVKSTNEGFASVVSTRAQHERATGRSTWPQARGRITGLSLCAMLVRSNKEGFASVVSTRAQHERAAGRSRWSSARGRITGFSLCGMLVGNNKEGFA